MPPLSPPRTAALTTLALVAFASNSLLCRLALQRTGIDAASFTTIRLLSGALVLWLLTRRFGGPRAAGQGNWPSALALFCYATAFSFAYVSLPTATGALLLIGAVQATMIGYGLWTGERLRPTQLAGLGLALVGLLDLLLPGLSAPPLAGSLLMLSAGLAWGVYSLRGKGAAHPMQVTAGNFMRAAPVAVALSAVMWVFKVAAPMSVDSAGLAYAVASGALTSGLGYVVWYTALPALKTTTAATVQLSVPVLAALGGTAFLGEAVTLRLALASAAILGGIALVVLGKQGADGH